jgi:hypothetical protein
MVPIWSSFGPGVELTGVLLSVGRTVKTAVLKLSLSRESLTLLDFLTKAGVYGSTPSEVAKTLVNSELQRLFYKEGIANLILSVPEAIAEQTKK